MFLLFIYIAMRGRVRHLVRYVRCACHITEHTYLVMFISVSNGRKYIIFIVVVVNISMKATKTTLKIKIGSKREKCLSTNASIGSQLFGLLYTMRQASGHHASSSGHLQVPLRGSSSKIADWNLQRTLQRSAIALILPLLQVDDHRLIFIY